MMELKLSSQKIWIYEGSVDFRKSIDGLSALAHDHPHGNLREDIYIFYNRHRDRIKVLAWHGNGFVLLYKRLEQGRFRFSNTTEGYTAMNEQQLSWLLAGLDWVSMSSWKTLTFDNYY